MIHTVDSTSLERLQEIVETWDADPGISGMLWRGINVWPVARVLFHQFARASRAVDLVSGAAVPAPEAPAIDTLGDFAMTNARNTQALVADVVRRDLAHRLGPCDVLLVSAAVNAYASVNGKAFDPFLDSLYMFFHDRYRFAKVELLESNSKLERLIPPVGVDPAPFLQVIAGIDRLNGRLGAAAGDQRVCGYPGFRAAQEAAFGRCIIGEGVLLEAARDIEYRSRLFKLLYHQARPKLVLVVDYAHRNSAAACKAARDMGIPCADIQHGAAAGGRYSIKWEPWRSVPAGGYALLPDVFWVWGPRTRDRMAVSGSAHRVVVGGHPWLTLHKDSRFASLRQVLPEALRHRLGQAGKRVLISFPNDLDAADLDAVLTAMAQAPKDWLWLLRLHPTDRHQEDAMKRHLAERLQRCGGAETEIDVATRANLASLLAEVDVHLTDQSSSCIEALEFGVPTVLYGRLGHQAFADYIDEGALAAATGAGDMLAAIREAAPPSRRYITTDPEVAAAAMETLLNMQPERPDPCAYRPVERSNDQA